jgi:hypothetical protein
MRYKRLRKFRDRNKSFILSIKIMLVMHFSFFFLNALTTDTNALFRSGVANSNSIKATWDSSKEVWDRSSLEFWNEDMSKKQKEANPENSLVSDPYQIHYNFSCEEGLYGDIFNDGQTMAGKSIFLVRYSTNDEINKNKPGTIIYEGEIPIIESMKLERLKFFPDLNDYSFKPGVYKMSALQRPLHLGGTKNESIEYKGRFEIWAEKSVQVTESMINQCKQK